LLTPARGERIVFLDTNVLVYAYDRHQGTKRARALQLVEAAGLRRQAAISAQVLAETFSVLTRKLKAPFPAEEAARIVDTYAAWWPVEPVTATLVRLAARGATKHCISFWDALILAAALAVGATHILSEDFQHGRVMDGVRVLDPFREDFEFARLLG
jgi:predicted nucleic acid-binding protein